MVSCTLTMMIVAALVQHALDPRKSPFLPSKSVGIVTRFVFNVLIIPLIYTTTATSLSPSTIGNYWFVVVASFFVLAISFVVATLLNYCIRIRNPRDYCALRIAATFPNVVTIPILVFSSLCEFSVVYEGYASNPSLAPSDMKKQCVGLSNTLVFCYFFSWSLVFWGLGYGQLLDAAQMPTEETARITPSVGPRSSTTSETGIAEALPELEDTPPSGAKSPSEYSVEESSIIPRTDTEAESPSPTPLWRRAMRLVLLGLWRTATSPGFVALVLGFVTACIVPLKSVLFDAGGALRFLGSSLESLGQASVPLSNLVAAASLVESVNLPVATQPNNDLANADVEHPAPLPPESRSALADQLPASTNDGEEGVELEEAPAVPLQLDGTKERTGEIRQRVVTSDPSTLPENMLLADPAVTKDMLSDNPIMSDPNYGPFRGQGRRSSDVSLWKQSLRRTSTQLVRAFPRSTPETRRIVLWFTLSRMVLAPAAVIGILIGLECSQLLSGIPALAKLVVIVTASTPGALIVVVLLQLKVELADTAAAVAKVYLPTYLIGIFTITAWTIVGLFLTLPDENGNSPICPA